MLKYLEKKCNIQNSTVKKEIQKEIRKYFKLNGNKTSYKNLCVATRVVLREHL